jgi:predicted nucleic acid-binding protein
MRKKHPGALVSGKRGPVLVDSGAWLAFVSANDGHHATAARLFAVALGRRIALCTTNLIVAEVHRLLVFRVGIGAARAFLTKIDASSALTVHFCDGTDHARGLAWLDRLADQEISYADAVSFAVMQRRKCASVMTFDRDFTVAGFSRWQEVL